MTKTEIKKKFEEFYKAFNAFMEEDVPDKEQTVWKVAGDFDLKLPGRNAEFIPELNDFEDIACAFDDGQLFSVPFVTDEILKLSIATENSFYVQNICVDPVMSSNNILEYGFELRDWDDRVLNEIWFGDYVPTDFLLIDAGVPFDRIAEDINAFVEGYGRD